MKRVASVDKFIVYALLTSAILMVIPLLIRIPQFFLSLLNTLMIYALLAIGWNIIGGYLNYYSFGHGVFFGIGAYVVALLMRDYKAPPFITLPIAILIASTIALITGYPSLRLRGIYFAFSTVSINYIFMLIISLAPWAGPLGVTLPPHPFEPYFWELVPYEMLLIGILGTTLLMYWISRSKINLAFSAIRYDEEAAEVRGINTTKYKLLAFALSAIPPAISGGIYCYYTLYIDPATVFSPQLSMYAIAMTLFGGTGTVLGPIIGAGIFIIISQLFRYSLTQIAGLHLVVTGAIVLGIVSFMPEGILGKLKKELRVNIP